MYEPSKDQKTHFFHANAMALGGRITQPFDEILEVQAGISLPSSGGYGSARVENYRFKEIVSFKTAYTQVTGSPDRHGGYSTLATATIEDLNVLDVFTAKRVVARIASEYPAEGPQVPRIIPVGSYFEDLRIAGFPLKIEFDESLLCGRDKFEEVAKAVSSSPKGIIVSSLVKNIEPPCAEWKKGGNLLVVPQFGAIHLAEFLITPYWRRLIMFRVELGCSVSGAIEGGGGQGGGTTYP